MPDSPLIDGNKPVDEPFSLRREIAMFRTDPLDPFLNVIHPELEVLSDDVSRYREAYLFHFLSLKRFFTDLHYARIWDTKLKWVHRDGKTYTATQRRQLPKVHQHNEYMEFDFSDCILHARILCDRTIALAHHFLRGPRLPSFTSFSDHKKFLLNNRDAFRSQLKYIDLLESSTVWFDDSLKHFRDKFIVHAAPKHMKVYGYITDNDLSAVLLLPMGPQGNEFSKVKPFNMSVRRLGRDIRDFLSRFCAYALHMAANEQ
jgi:hypothetical protein